MMNLSKNICTTALGILSVAKASAFEKAEEKPNIIIFLTDDQGWGDLGCYGHSVIKTPNIDKFAGEGMLFTNAHSAGAVSSPSRAAILTGRTPYRNGVYTIHLTRHEYPFLRKTEITLPQLLKQQGYATCLVGKWHLGSFNPELKHPLPSDLGFNHWFATQSNAAPNHLNPKNFIRNGKPVGKTKGFSSGIIVDEAIRWLETDKKKNQPFFLTVWTHEPHTPIGTANQFLDLYKEIKDEVNRAYYGNISQLDHAFGNLMKWIEKSGIKDNTLIVFTSDNGPAWTSNRLDRIRESAGHHRGAKAWLYEGGIRVPCIIRYPAKVQAKQVSHATINGTDFFPTFLDMLNIQAPTDRVIDGISIWDHLCQNKALPKRPAPLYWRYDGADNDLKVAYREGNWVLLADRILDRCELYNLEDDWQQRNNLVYHKEHFERFAEMKKQMVEHHHAIENEGPNEWWQKDPDPLIHWKQNTPEGIERHLQGTIPEKKPEPYHLLIEKH